MTEKTFDELYPSKESYQRFDQRNTAFGQSLTKTGKVVEFGGEEYRSNKIKQEIPGFSLVEYAFNGAAGLYEYPKDTLANSLKSKHLPTMTGKASDTSPNPRMYQDGKEHQKRQPG